MASYNGADKRLEYLFLNGGGGGGGTTVVANPAGDATDELEKLQVANIIYGVPTAIGGVGLFVDTNNVIKASTSIPANTDVSYTATQDCFVRYTLVTAPNAQAKATIDGVTIFTTYIPSTVGVLTLGDSAYLKKGQTITFNQTYTQSNGSYAVYGLLRGSEGGVYLPACYSSAERQVGVFTDGKPIYQKTISCGTLPNNATKNVAHNISNLDVVVNAFGFAKSTVNQTPIPFVNNTTVGSQVAMFIDDTNITLRTSDDRSIYSGYVTLQYTKTTDTAGGGIWTPSGGEAHHYSTDEQVVGTWTDGSTVYEKTFLWTTAMSVTVNGSWYNTNVDISYVDKIIDASIGNNIWRIGVLSVFKNSNKLHITSGGSMGNNTLTVNRIILRYTKASS